MQQTRYFTPREANETLPLVKKIVADILKTGARLRNLAMEHGRDSRQQPAVREVMAEVDELCSELENIGCSYKDWNFNLGLVDFPSVIDGEEVLLCWRSDEADILFFHGMHDGYAGRRPIPDTCL